MGYVKCTGPDCPICREYQDAKCAEVCGDMGKIGFHSVLCPKSGVNHPSRPQPEPKPEWHGGQ